MDSQPQTTLDQFLDEIGYAYFEAGLDGVFTRVNASLCQVLGYPPAGLVGRHFGQFTDPAHRPGIERVLQAVYASGIAQRGFEFPFLRRDGTAGIAEGSLALARDAAGQPVGFRGLLQDVTDRKGAETELKDRATALQQAKQAAERELEIGRRIQADFLPEELPQIAGWELACHFKAAREVAGDFYDAFALSGGKRLGLVVADVCDKGVGAALFMALFRSLIRAFADQHATLGWMDVLSSDRGASAAAQDFSLGRRRSLLSTGTAALKNAIDLTNQYITRNHGRTNMFATVFFGVLDPATGALMYINGGQEPPILIGAGGIKDYLHPTGPAVGLLPGLEFGIGQVDLEPGDTLLAFTDGIPDANSPQDEFYGHERIQALLQAPVGSAQALIERLQADLEAHIGPAVQYDDITMLALRRVPHEGAE